LAPASLILEVDPPEHQPHAQGVDAGSVASRLQQLRWDFSKLRPMRWSMKHCRRETLDAIPDLVQRFPLTVFPDAVRHEARGSFQHAGLRLDGVCGFGPVTPWYEELMMQAETVFGLDHGALPARCAGSGRHRRGYLLAR